MALLLPGCGARSSARWCAPSCIAGAQPHARASAERGGRGGGRMWVRWGAVLGCDLTLRCCCCSCAAHSAALALGVVLPWHPACPPSFCFAMVPGRCNTATIHTSIPLGAATATIAPGAARPSCVCSGAMRRYAAAPQVHQAPLVCTKAVLNGAYR